MRTCAVVRVRESELKSHGNASTITVSSPHITQHKLYHSTTTHTHTRKTIQVHGGNGFHSAHLTRFNRKLIDFFSLDRNFSDIPIWMRHLTILIGSLTALLLSLLSDDLGIFPRFFPRNLGIFFVSWTAHDRATKKQNFLCCCTRFRRFYKNLCIFIQLYYYILLRHSHTHTHTTDNERKMQMQEPGDWPRK